MDASAYLQKQGWRGQGHSLDKSDRGIKKPLLVSKKVDVLGVGLNKHAAVSDQWWLRAFDAGLKTFGTGQESTLANVQKHGVNRGGLYARFTKGEGVPGSIGQSPIAGSEVTSGTGTPVEAQRDTMDTSTGAAKTGDRKRKRGDESGEKNNHTSKKTKQAGKAPATHGQGGGKQLRVDQVILEAEKRGIIPSAPKEASKRTKRKQALALTDKPSAEFVAVLAQAGLDAYTPCVTAGGLSAKEDKIVRGKLRRAVKAAAKAAKKMSSNPIPAVEKTQRARKSEKNTDGSAAGHAKSATGFENGSDEVKLGMAPKGDVKSSGVEPEKKKQRRLKPEKLAQYEARARLKGVSLEDYMARRDEKYAAKQAEKKAEASTAPDVDAEDEDVDEDVDEDEDDEVDFVIDTAGDESLATKPAGSKASGAIVWDPKAWKDTKVKDLPKPVRKARLEWLRARREERKARAEGREPSQTKTKAKAKGARKVEARERFVKQILQRSREALVQGGAASGGGVTIDGVENVPLVKVKKAEGKFDKEETALARTVARRVIRNAKREERAAEGKGKGWKKKGKKDKAKGKGKKESQE